MFPDVVFGHPDVRMRHGRDRVLIDGRHPVEGKFAPPPPFCDSLMMTMMIMMDAIGGDLHVNTWMSKKNRVEIRGHTNTGRLVTVATMFGTV